MHTNAHKCAGLVDHTYIHKRRRVDSRLDSHGSIHIHTQETPSGPHIHTQETPSGIKAKDIGNIATKMGCPEEKTTKIAKLMWICTEYLHDPHGYN